MLRKLLARLLWGRHEETAPVPRPARPGAQPVRSTHAAVKSRVYRSLDEVPPHLRAEAEALLAQAQTNAGRRGFGSASMTRATFQYTGDDGVTHTYDSLEDMPPEIRARFEHLQPPNDPR